MKQSRKIIRKISTGLPRTFGSRSDERKQTVIARALARGNLVERRHLKETAAQISFARSDGSIIASILS